MALVRAASFAEVSFDGSGDAEGMGTGKTDKAVATEPMLEHTPAEVHEVVRRGLQTPPLERTETNDSVEIVCDVRA